MAPRIYESLVTSARRKTFFNSFHTKCRKITADFRKEIEKTFHPAKEKPAVEKYSAKAQKVVRIIEGMKSDVCYRVRCNIRDLMQEVTDMKLPPLEVEERRGSKDRGLDLPSGCIVKLKRDREPFGKGSLLVVNYEDERVVNTAGNEDCDVDLCDFSPLDNNGDYEIATDEEVESFFNQCLQISELSSTVSRELVDTYTAIS